MIDKEKKYSELELLDPNIGDEDVSFIIYQGNWSNIKFLKQNPKLIGQSEEFWFFISKDIEFFWTPWYPVMFFLFIMGLNLIFNIYQQFYSLVLSIISLSYISIGVPFLLSVKEQNRINFLDKYLENSPYHRSRFQEIKKD